MGFEGTILDRDVAEMGLEGNKSAGRSDYVLWSMERATEEVTIRAMLSMYHLAPHFYISIFVFLGQVVRSQHFTRLV